MSRFPELPDEARPEPVDYEGLSETTHDTQTIGEVTYDAVTCDGATGRDIVDGLPGEKVSISEVREPLRRASFGELTRDELEEAHPYRFAEDVSEYGLGSFYAVPFRPGDTWVAWSLIEEAVHNGTNPDLLDQAALFLEGDMEAHAPVNPNASIYDKFADARVAERWFDAALVNANVGAFYDRIERGEVRPETAGEVYRQLAEDVLPHTLNEGDAAEAIVNAIGARAALLDNPDEYLWPSSPREGKSPHHNDEGRVFNHDHYRIDDGTKVPLEVKLRAGSDKPPKHYDHQVTHIRCINDLGEAILGEGVIYNSIPRKQVRLLTQTFIIKAQRLMQAELRSNMTVRRPELDLATQALRRRIETDRAEKIMSESFRSPTLLDRHQ